MVTASSPSPRRNGERPKYDESRLVKSSSSLNGSHRAVVNGSHFVRFIITPILFSGVYLSVRSGPSLFHHSHVGSFVRVSSRRNQQTIHFNLHQKLCQANRS